MNKVIILIWLLSGLLTIANAQITSFKKGAAAMLVNSSSMSDSYAPATKSSYDFNSVPYTVLKGYDKKIKISYQIPSLTWLEWYKVRSRASSILDEHWFNLLFTNPELYTSIRNLAYNDFVPLSSYAPLTVKLNFRYNKTKPYRTGGFAPVNNSPAIHTKSLLIKK